MLMRFLILSLLSFGLVACSTSPEKTQAIVAAAQTEPVESYAVATLAPIGTFEWKAAPAYTKLALVRHNAAKALRKGEITVDEAIQVQSAADAIRGVLDDAVRDDAAGKSEDATRKLLKAGLQLLAVETLMAPGGGAK